MNHPAWPFMFYALTGGPHGGHEQPGFHFIQGTTLWVFVVIWVGGFALYGCFVLYSRYGMSRKKKKKK